MGQFSVISSFGLFSRVPGIPGIHHHWRWLTSWHYQVLLTCIHLKRSKRSADDVLTANDLSAFAKFNVLLANSSPCTVLPLCLYAGYALKSVCCLWLLLSGQCLKLETLTNLVKQTASSLWTFFEVQTLNKPTFCMADLCGQFFLENFVKRASTYCSSNCSAKLPRIWAN